MRTALGLFVAAIVCIAIAWWVAALPGSISATVAGTTIQTSTPVGIALLAVAFVVLYAIVRLLALLFSLPRRTGRWQQGRARQKGDVAVHRTLIALAANDAGAARREAQRGRRLLGDTPVTLLLAAQAGKQAGRADEATALYETLSKRRDSRLLGLRGLLRLAVEQEDWARASTIANEAEMAHPGAKWLRDERRHLAQQTGQWQDALRLSAPENKAAMAVEAARAEDGRRASLALAKQAFEADPGLPPATVLYAQALRADGRAKQANDVLRQGWAACPHPDIAEAVLNGIEDKRQRARELAVFVRSNPDNAESRMAVAHAALEAGMVSDARAQLDQARAAGLNDRRMWSMLAEAASLQGDTEAAHLARQSLATADADPIWRCTACGTHQDEWHAICGHCRTAGSIAWSRPGQANVPRPRPKALGRSGAGLEGLSA